MSMIEKYKCDFCGKIIKNIDKGVPSGFNFSIEGIPYYVDESIDFCNLNCFVSDIKGVMEECGQ